MRALRLVYGSYVNEEKYPLFKAEEQMLTFSHWFIIKSGEIEFCRKIADFIKAGLGTASVQDKKIVVEFENIGVKEEFDSHSYRWAHNLVHENVCKPEIESNKLPRSRAARYLTTVDC